MFSYFGLGLRGDYEQLRPFAGDGLVHVKPLTWFEFGESANPWALPTATIWHRERGFQQCGNHPLAVIEGGRAGGVNKWFGVGVIL